MHKPPMNAVQGRSFWQVSVGDQTFVDLLVDCMQIRQGPSLQVLSLVTFDENVHGIDDGKVGNAERAFNKPTASTHASVTRKKISI